MEICLLPCYRFLCNNNKNNTNNSANSNQDCHVWSAVIRIGMLLRGLGNPLLMVYMQCYLLGVGAASVIATLGGKCARALLQDFFFVYKVVMQ